MEARAVLLIAGCAAALAACTADAAPAVTPSDTADGGGGAPNDTADGGGGATRDASQGGAPGDASDGAHDATLDAPPAAPALRFVGRVDTSDGKGTRFEWPGVSLHARFRGTSVAMDFDDTGTSELAVFVDGAEHPKVVANGTRQTVTLASGLADGAHELLVWRRTEAFVGRTEIFGLSFSPGGALLAPPDPRPHAMEIIGDSITVGYGNEGSPGCTFSSTTENNYLAYGSVAARLLNAELYTVAWSGLGMYRNYGDVGPSAMPLPAYYDDALPTVPTPWDFSHFTPDVVVINLGTNDSSTHGDPGQPFIDAYVAFVQRLRTHYPSAQVVCIDATADVTQDIAQVVSTLRAGGDTKIEAFALSGQNASGCDGHPDTAADALMGQSLATEVAKVMGW